MGKACRERERSEGVEMPKCLVCGIELPFGKEYCPAKKMIEGVRVYNFGGCHGLKFETLSEPNDGSRRAPRFRSDRWLETLAKMKIT